MTEAEELELLELEEEEARLRALQSGNRGQIAGAFGPKSTEDVAGSELRSMGRAAGFAARSGPTLGADDELGAFLQGHRQLGAMTGNAIAPKPVEDWLRANLPSTQPIRDADGNAVSPIDVYRDARDVNEREKEDAREASPATFFTTELLSGAALPLGAVRTLGGAMKLGALLGGGAGLANSDADLTRGEVGKAAVDTAAGAGLGGILGGGGHLVGRAAPVVLRKAQDLFRRGGVAQGRRVLLNGADSLSNKLKLSDEAIQEALDSKAIPIFGTTEGASKRLTALREQYGSMYGELLEDLEARGVPGARVEDVADRLLARAAQDELASGADKAVSRRFLREASNAENVALGQPNLPLTRAEEIKKRLQQEARSEYNRMGGNTPTGEAKMEIASIFREANENAVEKAGHAAPYGSELQTLADAFVPMKNRMGRIIEADEAALRGATRGANRSSSGLMGQMAAGGALAAGNLPAAATGMAGSALLRSLMSRGASTVARGANAGAKLSKALANAAARNPTVLPTLGTRAFGGAERAADAEAQADGLTPEERGRLTALIRVLEGK